MVGPQRAGGAQPHDTLTRRIARVSVAALCLLAYLAHDDGGARVALLLTLALVTAGGTLAFQQSRRRPGTVPQAVTEPVASAPGVLSQWPATPLRSAWSATATWANGPRALQATAARRQNDSATAPDAAAHPSGGDAPEAHPVGSGPAAASPSDRHRAWTAEIEWRHTKTESRFCVIARATQGVGETAVAQSSPLEWPPTCAPSVEAMTDAVATLEASLEAAGWKPLPPGRAWYAKRFAWEPIALVSGAEPAETKLVESAPTPGSSPVGRPVQPTPASSPPGRRNGGAQDRPGAGRPASQTGADPHLGDLTRVRQLRRVVSVFGAAAGTFALMRRTPPAAAVSVLVVASAIALLLSGTFRAGDKPPAVLPEATPETIARTPAANAPARSKPARPAASAPARERAAPAAKAPARKPPARKPGNWPTSASARDPDAAAASMPARNPAAAATPGRSASSGTNLMLLMLALLGALAIVFGWRARRR
jgi:hypothetical protein